MILPGDPFIAFFIKNEFLFFSDVYRSLIPTPHHYAYFAQFDWLDKKFYNLINSMSRNLGTIFLPPGPKM